MYHEKEENPVIWENIDGIGENYAKWNEARHRKTNTAFLTQIKNSISQKDNVIRGYGMWMEEEKWWSKGTDFLSE